MSGTVTVITPSFVFCPSKIDVNTGDSPAITPNAEIEELDTIFGVATPIIPTAPFPEMTSFGLVADFPNTCSNTAFGLVDGL